MQSDKEGHQSNDRSDADYDLISLFDMGTVSNQENGPPKKIKSELVSIPRCVFTENSVSYVEDKMLSYFEEDICIADPPLLTSRSESRLKLNFSRGCGKDERDTDHFVMPSLRLDYMDDKEYSEPVRDRDKIWAIDSQRNILNKDPPTEKKNELALGEHSKPPSHPPLLWCPALQTALRKRRILRQAAVISDTHCFVDIYGLGVAGRVLAPGSATNRLLLIEAYSVWDSTTHSLVLHIPQLKRLLLGQEHLFVPGKKYELVRALVSLLYFDYTITYEAVSDTEEKSIMSRPLSRAKTKDIINAAPSTIQGELDSCNEAGPEHVEEEDSHDRQESEEDVPGSCTKTIHVSHLEKFKLPESYPQSIADIIRAVSTKDALLDTLRPGLTQTLRISSEKRINGPVIRRQEAAEKYRKEQAEFERKRLAWLAIPRRYKGWLSGKCIRARGKIVVMSCYRMPNRPSVLSIKGHAAFECAKLTHNLELGSMGLYFGIRLSPKKWEDDIAKYVVSRAAKLLTIGEADVRQTVYISYMGKNGSESQLSPLPTCIGFEKRRGITWARDRALPARASCAPDIPLHHEPLWVQSTSALGRRSLRKRRLYAGEQLCGTCRPRREVGRPRRILTRGKRIGHVYGVYSFYLACELCDDTIASIEDIEHSIANKEFGNQELPPCLGPGISITVEVYFPENPTTVAVRQGDDLGIGSSVLGGPTVLRLDLSRGDICRLVDDKSLLRVGFRLGHTFFEEGASEVEVKKVEDAWIAIANTIMNKCRWRRKLYPGNSEGYAAKVEKANELLVINSVDVTDEVIGKSREKVICPLPVMKAPISENDEDSENWSVSSKEVNEVSIESAQPVASVEELVLSLPTVIFNKTCSVLSESDNRSEVVLQILVWQHGIHMGVICFDREMKDIYFAQSADEQQEILCVELQASGLEEIAINMSFFAGSLTYQEEKLKDGTIKRYIQVMRDADVEDTTGFINDEYGSQAVEASRNASEAARARQNAGVVEAKKAEEIEKVAPADMDNESDVYQSGSGEELHDDDVFI
mmetsp:Transcript_8681/g.12959  ORF Transcript_8681/g.12959 Transcript_8681/m.12959 type:complete len:1038 (-) Transcript_8681:53-3166(-)|eukprot:CAMPEP_0185035544 /NCGR_PEP_ID=MMETSP1103-20130426/27114_1 /TAXON_ID=36769 /ORGANISM="Paraphysomonas bandaiensis, Strain Caron Lab Isolate" /LENGTH=1037 /DNA_ID=CAMNT_0027572669 /DNA_START=133 /DNA_END=3246 /DNA_ORIENTATION=-